MRAVYSFEVRTVKLVGATNGETKTRKLSEVELFLITVVLAALIKLTNDNHIFYIKHSRGSRIQIDHQTQEGGHYDSYTDVEDDKDAEGDEDDKQYGGSQVYVISDVRKAGMSVKIVPDDLEIKKGRAHHRTKAALDHFNAEIIYKNCIYC